MGTMLWQIAFLYVGIIKKKRMVLVSTLESAKTLHLHSQAPVLIPRLFTYWQLAVEAEDACSQYIYLYENISLCIFHALKNMSKYSVERERQLDWKFS